MARLIFLLIALILAVMFAVQNATMVTLTVFVWHLDASLAVIIAVCFALGAIVAALALLPNLYRRRSHEREMQARIADLETHHPPDPLGVPSASSPRSTSGV